MTDFPEFSHVGEVLRKVQDRLTAIEAEVRYLRGERSAEVEGKIGTIEGRLSAIDQRIVWGHEHLGALGRQVGALDERIRALGAAGEGKSQSRKNPKQATARKSPSSA